MTSKHIMDHSTKLLDKFTRDTADIITHKTQNISETLDKMAYNFYGSIERFLEEKGDSAKTKLEETLNKVYRAFRKPDEPTGKSDEPLNTQGGPHTQGFRLNPRFPHVRPLSNSPAKPRYNPFNMQEPQNRHNPVPPAQPTDSPKSEEEWNRFGPMKAEDSIEDYRPLPMLQAHKLVHHVKIPYPGKELTYTWYHTFRSAVKQYGILLIPVEEFKKDKSLCPRNYYGTKVDAQRYKEMADALYQLLILTDTIPTE